MEDRRGIIIHFMDGSKMNLDFPKQVASQGAAAIKLKEALAARHLIVEADGALMVIPFENIKFIQVYPAPPQLPEYAIKAASFSA
jgi:hypothetical protein